MIGIKRLFSLVVLGVFIAAIWILYHEIEQFHYRQIVGYASSIPVKDLCIAFLCTAASYLVLTGYDLLAVSYLEQPLQFRQVMLASFISYSFSNTIGLSVLTSGSLRYRFYTLWGLSAEQVTKLVSFVVVTFWVGILAAGGLIFVCEYSSLSGVSGLSSGVIHVTGVLFLLLIAVYLGFLVLRRTPLQLKSWEFSIPKIQSGLAQIAIGIVDWGLAAGVLFVLLPPQLDISFPQLTGIFLLAQIVALISHVPGGLGVFESMILLLTPQASAAALLGSLFLFRLIYYLCPLGLATLSLVYIELLNRKSAVSRIVQVLGQWGSVVLPKILALLTLIGGMILLFSGATPVVPSRVEWLKDLVPLTVVEFSHFLGSLIGAVLLLLARGIDRRLDGAYLLTVVLLGVGSLLSLVKGADYEEAVVLLVMFILLLPCRHYFYRKSSFFAESFTMPWAITILIVFLSATWLGLFSYKHVMYRQDLWWQFALHGDASRFMRASVGAGALLFLFGLAKMLKPAAPVPPPNDEKQLQTARNIVENSSSAEANLALLGDKLLYFDEEERGFVMYGIQGHSWIAMGDPVAPVDLARDLAWNFRELVEQHGGQPVFYEVGPQLLHIYLDMGLSLYKLGEDARVRLSVFSLDGSSRKGLRYTKRKLEKDGCDFEIIGPGEVEDVMDRLQQISDAWLQSKNSREKGFSLGFFSPAYLRNFPTGVIRRNGEIIAFANLWTTGEKKELSIDLMRYSPEAPGDIMEFLLVHLILWGKEQGFEFFSLGMAPLAGLENRPFAPLWHRIGALLFRHGEQFYNFEGLRRYKEKFEPEWEPRYLACPGCLVLPKILTDIAALIAGGFKGIFRK